MLFVLQAYSIATVQYYNSPPHTNINIITPQDVFTFWHTGTQILYVRVHRYGTRRRCTCTCTCTRMWACIRYNIKSSADPFKEHGSLNKDGKKLRKNGAMYIFLSNISVKIPDLCECS